MPKPYMPTITSRRSPRLSVSLPDLRDSKLEPPPEQRSQRGAVGIAHPRGYLVDARVPGLQQVHCALNTQRLEVRERRLAEHVLHVSGERALARARGLRRVVQRESSR